MTRMCSWQVALIQPIKQKTFHSSHQMLSEHIAFFHIHYKKLMVLFHKMACGCFVSILVTAPCSSLPLPLPVEKLSVARPWFMSRAFQAKQRFSCTGDRWASHKIKGNRLSNDFSAAYWVSISQPPSTETAPSVGIRWFDEALISSLETLWV